MTVPEVHTGEEAGGMAHSLNVLSKVRHSLEDAYLELTGASVEYHGRSAEVAR